MSVTAGAPGLPPGRCTVLEIGDSIGNDIGWGLTRQLPTSSGVGLVQTDRSATGLANPTSFDWTVQLPVYLDQYHPNLVIVCIGGNDQQGMEVDGSAVQFPSGAWQAAYLARVAEIVGEVHRSGALLVWVGLPVMRQPSYSQGAGILNDLYRRGTATAPGAVFLPTWSLLGGPTGTFHSTALVNGRPAGLRDPDGIHLSFSGENVAATYLVREIATRFHVQLEPSDPSDITGWG
jgi:hypothetical protein